jgi:predicted 2-oxoglutarate/Fe(II)-dependent dioxygenase YbiX
MKQLLKLLEQIKKPGSFCSLGKAPSFFPGLAVNHIGTIGLPLIETQARQIIDQSIQAPYGQGEQTRVDTEVRRVWELQPEQFQLTHPDWPTYLADIIKQVGHDLGITEGEIISEPYKLLMYETGSFFVSHRDTEKMTNMFATLIITLPSQHEGGELIIRHAGEEACFASGGSLSDQEICYAAFYADCEHEVKPLTSGYRLCLVYNLALADVKQQPMAPEYAQQTDQIAKQLSKWAQQDDADTIAILLDHHYSQAHLSLKHLKNLDGIKAKILMEAAKRADCQAYLALVTLWESGEADYNDDYYYRKRKWRYDDDEDEENDFNGNNCDMLEVYESSLTLDHWQDSDGHDPEFSELHIDEDQIISRQDLRDSKPDQREYEGPTGNAGATLEYWYYRAAIVIWPQRKHLQQLSDFGEHTSVYLLQKMLEQNSNPADCRQFASYIMNCWKLNTNHYTDESDFTLTLHQTFLDILFKLQDKALFSRFLDEILAINFVGTEGEALAKSLAYFGWQSAETALKIMASHANQAKIVALLSLLQTLADESIYPVSDPERLALCQKTLLISISTWQALLESQPYNHYHWTNQNQATRQDVLLGFFKTAQLLNQNEALQALTVDILAKPKALPLREALLPAIHQIGGWLIKNPQPCPAFTQLFNAGLQQIQTLAETIIEEPKDWAQTQQLTCSCQNCRAFNIFLLNPDQTQFKLCANEDKRSHLKNNIRNQKLDINQITEKKGRPYTLICTKNRASYHEALKQKASDQQAWQDLIELRKQYPI